MQVLPDENGKIKYKFTEGVVTEKVSVVFVPENDLKPVLASELEVKVCFEPESNYTILFFVLIVIKSQSGSNDIFAGVTAEKIYWNSAFSQPHIHL